MRFTPLALGAALSLSFACAPEQRDGPDIKDEVEDALNEEPEGCVYPETTGLNAVGSIMPAMSWDPAMLGAGNAVTLDLEELHCERQEQVRSLVFVLVAEWCPNCPDYVRMVNSQAAAMAASGAQIVWVNLQDRNYQLAPSINAQNYIADKIGDGVGYRVGSASASSPIIFNSNIWSAVPGAFIVRTEDMKVVASQEDSNYVLDFASITANIDLDDPTRPPFQSACAEDGDEDFEPNDSAAQAGLLEGEVVVSGGICNEAPDFYRVAALGDWQLDLEFTHAVGDLDVYVMDEVTMTPTARSESVDDNESLTGSGPALIQIVGYGGSSAPYTLRLTPQ